MAAKYRVGIIGTGRPWKSPGATGFGMAHGHARGYLKTGRCELTAIADVNAENAEAFAKEYGSPAIYSDYTQMLKRERLDIVSICTWPALHAPMVRACAEAGVRAVHCEKPMALRWGEARAMHEACVQNGVQLTFNHQRRFLQPFQTAREMLDEGAIGTLLRIEGQCADLFDWGTHWFDMFFYYNHDQDAEWVLGQIDARRTRLVFGAPVEDQGVSLFKFRNGVRALLVTGYDADIGCANRLIGTDGVIEIGWEAPWLRYHARSGGWREVEMTEGIHDPVGLERAMADVVSSLDQGLRPLLSSFNAIRSTEVLFATYESARVRGRIDLPLTNPEAGLAPMLEAGAADPHASQPR
ncbi:MAG: Gfo/Idh/MocA family protein [Chthonomonadales bacterium]